MSNSLLKLNNRYLYTKSQILIFNNNNNNAVHRSLFNKISTVNGTRVTNAANINETLKHRSHTDNNSINHKIVTNSTIHKIQVHKNNNN